VLPEIVPLSEQGFSEFEAISWNATLAPAGTPTSILACLHTELVALLNSDEIKEKFSVQYFSMVGSSPAELQDLIRQEKSRWDAVIETLKLSLD